MISTKYWFLEPMSGTSTQMINFGVINCKSSRMYQSSENCFQLAYRVRLHRAQHRRVGFSCGNILMMIGNSSRAAVGRWRINLGGCCSPKQFLRFRCIILGSDLAFRLQLQVTRSLPQSGAELFEKCLPLQCPKIEDKWENLLHQ